MIDALLHELDRHRRQGRPNEVERIKRELAALGHVIDPVETAVVSAPETAAAPALENTVAPETTETA